MRKYFQAITILLILFFSTSSYNFINAQSAENLSIEQIYFKNTPAVQYQDNRMYILIHSDIDFQGKISVKYQEILLIEDIPVIIIGGKSTGFFIDTNYSSSGEIPITFAVKDKVGNLIGSDLSKNIYVEPDNDGDSIADVSDSDDDNDGIPDSTETLIGTDKNNVDTDNDGYSDSTDIYPLDPNLHQKSNISTDSTTGNTESSTANDSDVESDPNNREGTAAKTDQKEKPNSDSKYNSETSINQEDDNLRNEKIEESQGANKTSSENINDSNSPLITFQNVKNFGLCTLILFPILLFVYKKQQKKQVERREI